MSRKLCADVVAETTTTTGTGTVALTAIGGFARFSDRFSNGDRVYYSIRDGINWEIGKGTYTAANQLARTTILGSLSANVWGTSALNLSGSATVRSVAPEALFQAFLKEEVVLVSGPTTLVDGYAYGVQTSAIALTLPASPTVGDRVRIFMAEASITGVTVIPNGEKIGGTAGTMTIDTTAFSFAMRYVDASYGWTVE